MRREIGRLIDNLEKGSMMPGTADDTPKPFSVLLQKDKYSVRSSTGRVIMACNDEGSAAHYAALLNASYADGYRQGYRDCRNG